MSPYQVEGVAKPSNGTDADGSDDDDLDDSDEPDMSDDEDDIEVIKRAEMDGKRQRGSQKRQTGLKARVDRGHRVAEEHDYDTSSETSDA